MFICQYSNNLNYIMRFINFIQLFECETISVRYQTILFFNYRRLIFQNDARKNPI